MKNTEKVVYQVWFSTFVGPTFSTRAKAEEWLDGEYDNDRDRWVRSWKLNGYPKIRCIVVDDTSNGLIDR
jgi:hypothetical protein